MTEAAGSWMPSWLCSGAARRSRAAPQAQPQPGLARGRPRGGCWRLPACGVPADPHRNPTLLLFMHHGQLLLRLPAQLLIHQSVVSGYCSPWLLILCPMGRFRNSTAQSHSFQALSIYRPRFLHTGAHSSLMVLITWPLVVHKPEHSQQNSKKQEKHLCLFYP